MEVRDRKVTGMSTRYLDFQLLSHAPFMLSFYDKVMIV